LLLKELEEEVTYLYHPDHLGSVSVVSDQKGLPYERVEYLPFGEVWIEETDPATGYIPFRFTSKELDEETGLYYHGARYYEPTISRWMSADPAGFALVNPMERDDEGGWRPKASYSIIEAVNWYAYVSNNPVIYVDPTGMDGILFGDGGVRYFFKLTEAVAATMVVAVADAAGRAGNFVFNLLTGKVEVSATLSLKAGDGLLSGTLEVSKNGVSFTPSSNMAPEAVSKTLQDWADAPIKIGVDGIETGFDAKVADITISLSGDGSESMTLGITAGVDLFEALGVEAGVNLTGSTQEGPFATVGNGMSKELNKYADRAIWGQNPYPF